MKKELIKILVIFFVTVGAVVFGLNYLFLSGNSIKSRAAGETMNLSFDPASVTVAANQDFTVTILAKPSPSIYTVLRGYKTRINFDKNTLRFKSIEYKLGVVSAGLGATTDDAAAINSATASGQINIVGEIQTPTGSTPLTPTQGAELATITFTSLGTSGTSVTMSDSGFYSINGDMSLFSDWIMTAQILDINSGEPTPTGNVKLNLKLKFQGISGKRPTEALGRLNVKIKLYNKRTGQATEYKTVDFIVGTLDDQGIWAGQAIFNVNTNNQYTLYVKGPYHLQKKICDGTPTETAGGTYRCTKGNITLKNGVNDLDLSGIILLAGDLPDQDGTVSSYDTSLIRNNLGKTDDSSLANSDVNRDGVVDTQDYSLVIAALSVKNDEE